MSEKVEQIMAQIRSTDEEIIENGAKAVELTVVQARHFVALRKKARGGGWGRALEKLHYAPRVALRYVNIGKHWPDPDRTPGSDLLAKLPSDLQKLEWLCRLPEEGLRELADTTDLRQEDRVKISRKVKGLLGEPVQPQKRNTPDAIKSSLERFSGVLLTNVEELPPDQRVWLIDQLDAALDELKKELHEVEEESADHEDVDRGAADDGAQGAAEDAEEEGDLPADEEAAEPAAAKKSGATSAKPERAHHRGRRSKPQPV